MIDKYITQQPKVMTPEDNLKIPVLIATVQL